MSKSLLTVLLIVTMALITYIIRVIPMLIFRKKIKSQFVNSLLYYLPYAVLSAMTFPFVLHCSGNILTAGVGTAVALIVAFRKHSLVTVAIIASATVLGMELLLLYLL